MTCIRCTSCTALLAIFSVQASSGDDLPLHCCFALPVLSSHFLPTFTCRTWGMHTVSKRLLSAQPPQLNDVLLLQATLYHQLGMRKADFRKIVRTRRNDGLLQLRVPTIQTKLRFFKNDLGLSDEDICKLLVKCPRVMEHKVEGTMRPHLDLLQQHGVAKEDLGKVGFPVLHTAPSSSLPTGTHQLTVLGHLSLLPCWIICKLITCCGICSTARSYVICQSHNHYLQVCTLGLSEAPHHFKLSSPAQGVHTTQLRQYHLSPC